MSVMLMSPSAGIQQYAAAKDSILGPRAVARLHEAAVLEQVADWEVLVCVAWHESRFRPDARSKPNGNYNGMLQIGKRQHAKAMRDAGLDYNSEADRLRWGMRLYQKHGLQPWAVRTAARRDYARIKK